MVRCRGILGSGAHDAVEERLGDDADDRELVVHHADGAADVGAGEWVSRVQEGRTHLACTKLGIVVSGLTIGVADKAALTS